MENRRVISKHRKLSLHFAAENDRRKLCRGAVEAENIPFEPDLDNASVGSRKPQSFFYAGGHILKQGCVPFFVAMDITRVLTIAGSDSGGGAGIQADLKTVAALGGFGMSVITALTAQNTLGILGILEVPPDFVAAQFDAVAGDIGIDAAKTGMLLSAPIVRVVAEKVRQYGIERLVVDPVRAATVGTPLLAEEAWLALREELVPLALVLTPNLAEAEALTGGRIETQRDMRRAAKMIHALGPRNVLVKGGHLAGEPADILYDGVDFHVFSGERIATNDTHGTGCTYAAAIAAGLAAGFAVPAAVAQAKAYITVAIRHSLRLGAGHGPVNHMAWVLGGEGAHGAGTAP
jgi:hydroxymethylpyrimidine/phosphomethylpyrimidine kinase